MKIRAISVVRAILRAKTFLRCPGLNQSAVHGEVLVAHELVGALIYFREELLRHIRGQQPVAVLKKHRVIP